MTRIEVLPINPLTLPYYAGRTAWASWRRYRSARRGSWGRRLASVLRPDLRTPVFLIGSPRSGTTFLGDCLARLPEMSYHFEPIATKAAARYVTDDGWSFARARWFYRSVYAWLMRIHLDGDLRFAEKTPRNAFVIPFLREAFPGARFIHIVRDGRDAALSWSKRPWLQAASAGSGRREPGGYRYGPYPRFWVESDRAAEFETTTDLHRCIWGWRRYTETALEAVAALPDDEWIEVRYETLVTDPDGQSTRLLDFLEITRDGSRAAFRDAVGAGRVDSVGRWRAECSEEDVTKMMTEAGALLAALGYADA